MLVDQPLAVPHSIGPEPPLGDFEGVMLAAPEVLFIVMDATVDQPLAVLEYRPN